MASKRGDPKENRKNLRDLNDEEYASGVLQPERKAVAKSFNKSFGSKVITGAVAGARSDPMDPVSSAVLGAGAGAALGLTDMVGGRMADDRLDRAEKRIRLTKPLIDEAKAKNKALRGKK